MRSEENSTRVSEARPSFLPFKVSHKNVFLFAFRFDGEQLDTNKRAEDHELEGGEMIDMFISTS